VTVAIVIAGVEDDRRRRPEPEVRDPQSGERQ
jgi:hypothetical protein